jgi:serine-type D-Ala-D-Ala carboxypeptidase (penicillin-binding protein 5/6)
MNDRSSCSLVARTVWSRVGAVLLCLPWLLLANVAAAQPSSLAEKIEPLIAAHQGTVAVAVRHLPTGEGFLHNEDRPMPTASLIKLPVMVEAYRQAEAGRLDLERMITLTEDDPVRGSGILTRHFSPGMQLSVRDAIRLMIAYSDNTATNLVLDQIGLEATAAAMEAMGLPNTKVHAKVFRRGTSVFPERSAEFGLGSTTAAEMATLLERLHRGELASEEGTQAMLEHLFACQSTDRIPRLLPRGTKVAHKTGSVSRVRTDAGIIESPSGPLIVVGLTAENADQRWSDENAACLLIARIAREAYEHFNPQPETPDQPEELAEGADGWLVEALQRTLNVRLDPSPDLTIDGEFGPMTKEAVSRFQESAELPVTGAVDAATWKALGSLVTGNLVVTDPETFDLNLSDPRLADELEGRPFVTCKAWGIGDPRTGELLWGENADRPLENASTTKLMTAWIALRTVRESPERLQEPVTVSRRAARTPGSSAKLRAGETLTLDDLLYGLLLPSGNDASVVIAEHLGGMFDPPEEDPESDDPLVRFVAEMNRTARSLGMDQTRFQNPHGLSARGHHTSAGDLVRLAAALIEDGRILPYVQTRKHVGRLEGEAGYLRYELWTNTNRLLGIEGYLGMKTGTTRGAGACLVSLGERDGQRLIAVVLGSTSTDARYTDTRNLFRWAWQQLAAGSTD